MNTVKPSRRGRTQLIAVAVLCFLPFVSAIVITKFFPDWSPLGTANNGTLVLPLVGVNTRDLASIDGDVVTDATLSGKWSVVMFVDGTCAAPCLEKLEHTEEMRLLLNKDAHRIQRLLVFPSEASTDLPITQLREENSDIRIVKASPRWRGTFAIDGVEPMSSGRLFVVDPQGFLMMFYAPDVSPRLILKDLKRLLKTSRLG